MLLLQNLIEKTGHQSINGLAAVLVLAIHATANAQVPDGTTPPPIPRNWTIDDYRAAVADKLPQFDSTILQAPPGPPAVEAFNLLQFAQAVSDTPAPQIFQGGNRILSTDPNETRFYLIDPDEGELRYVSKERRFRFSQSAPNRVSEATAIGITDALANAIGLPTSETRFPIVHTMVGHAFSTDGQETPPHDRYRIVTVHRRVNGRSVPGSRLRVVINNEGQIARFRAVWPRFELFGGAGLRNRVTIVNAIANRIESALQGAEPNLDIELAYCRFGLDRFQPVAHVTVADLQDAGMVFNEELIVWASDADQDGVPDASDNCPYQENPLQSDADGDGIGDVCDNCPNLFNPSQLDTDENGIGDACEALADLVGACCLSVDGCDEMTASECAAAGGTWIGPGIPCALAPCAGSCALPFVRGDVNGDLLVNLADPIRLLTDLFSTGVPLPPVERSDVNGDLTVDIADATYALSFLVLGGPPPPAPFPDPGC